MIADIVEGSPDRSEAGLRAILVAQAKLRVFVAIPVVIIEAGLYLASPENIATRLVLLTLCYCLYMLAVHLLVRYRTSLPARELLVATAVLDPLALSAWVAVTGEYGSLIVGFYLFTILGFGFRTGRALMYLCQLTAVAGFLLVFLSVPYWQGNSTLFVALMLPLVVVPMYSGGLLKTLREAREHAERESKAKSELLAMVSHELRTPLTGIISATELIAAEPGKHEVARLSNTILKLSNELLREINNLLDEAKFGARAAELVTHPTDLARELEHVRDALESTAKSKQIGFHAILDPAISDWVEVDAHHLTRVLLNLAGNAVKFTDCGEIEVRIALVESTAATYRLRFSVTDSGIGIPESFHARMFEPFVQAEQGVGRRYGGTGLGLALSRRIVELMGGELSFESETGKGSCFWFEVSLVRSAPLLSASGELADSLSTNQIVARRILVAEDNETNLLLLRELLQMDGHTVTTCSSGTAALDLLVDQDFDLLLLDYNLGDMDGVRVLQTYQLGCVNVAPALFLTADTTRLTATRLRDSGGQGVLYKPITLAKLRLAIEQLDVPGRASAAVAADADALAVETSRSLRPTLAAVASNPLDPEVIEELKSVSLRAEFFPALLREASTDILRCGAQIRVALVESDHSTVRDCAHALKGVSANIGALRCLALANRLMSASRAELDDSAQRWSTDLADALEVTVAALEREIAADPGAHSAGGTAAL
ncbi:MAG: response regulator [Xanthomonadales bacterium]|nr:response regulator [Xanthomonadales bacterium]